ncbi:MAG: hypothetical protein R8M45_09985 [Ghiorsea sp.]
MEFKKLMGAALMLGAITFGATTASANQGASDAFNAHFTTSAACTTCHANSSKPIGVFSAIGLAWRTNTGTANAGPTTQAGWDALDADTAATMYLPVLSTWSFTPPTNNDNNDSGSGGCVTSSVATPLMMFLAILSFGFFVRRKKD